MEFDTLQHKLKILTDAAKYDAHIAKGAWAMPPSREFATAGARTDAAFRC